MNKEEFWKFTYNLEALLGGGEGSERYAKIIRKMTSILDNADADDVFGTQGWKYQVGLED